jgi:hypothetical protein
VGHIGVGLPARLHGLAASTGWFIEDCELGESLSTNEFGAVVILDVRTLVTIPSAVVKSPTLVDAGGRSEVPAMTPGTELS